VFTITGCTIDYNLTINSDKQVEETTKIINSNEMILLHNESVNLFLTEQINTHKQIDIFRRYVFGKHLGKDSSYISIKRTYGTLKDYITSPTFNHLFENATITETEEYVSFQTTGEYYYNNVYGEQSEPDFYVGDINIQIRFHNKIIDSNADEIDEKSNTLKWKITDKNLEKSIYFKVSNEKRYDIIVIDYIMKNQSTIIISLSILVVIMIISLYVYVNFRKNNTI
jgi:hypothetical protein